MPQLSQFALDLCQFFQYFSATDGHNLMKTPMKKKIQIKQPTKNKTSVQKLFVPWFTASICNTLTASRGKMVKSNIMLDHL